MAKKYIVVGGVAGGASAAARLRRLDEQADIKIYEKGDDISFSNCSLPNYFGNEVGSISDLIFYDPDSFKKELNLDAHVHHEVIEIHGDQHEVVIKNLETQEIFTDSYDVLILSPGSHAVKPKITGIESPHVFSLKNVTDVRALDAHFASVKDNRVVVIGGGFIGVEIAENLRLAGKEVTLIEGSSQILSNYDEDFVQMLHKELYDKGIQLLLNQEVKRILKRSVVLDNGEKIEAQTVIVAVGIAPNTDFASKSDITVNEKGHIQVDANYQTNVADVYAVGDAIEVFHKITNQKTVLPLAGPTQKQARDVADHLNGRRIRNKGVIGSSCIKVFDFNAASTGLNERQCKEQKIDYRTALVIPCDRVSLLKEASPMHVKVVYAYPSGKILGAQAISKGDVVKVIDTIATVIHFHGDLEDLKELELAYAPDFSTAKDVVNFAGIVGLNYLNGDYQQVPLSHVRKLVEEGAYILDVRGKQAFEQSHIKGAVNIPLDEIRTRYTEIPKNQPVYVHCRTSWNSYYAICALKGYGFNNLINIQGSFLQLSYYEYFKDVTTNRPSIVTGYNFK